MSDTELRGQIKAIPVGVSWPYGSTGVLTEQTIDAFEKLIHTRKRALLAAIRAELPESVYSKLDKCPYCGNPHQYSCTCDTGFDAALADVAAILRKYEEMK